MREISGAMYPPRPGMPVVGPGYKVVPGGGQAVIGNMRYANGPPVYLPPPRRLICGLDAGLFWCMASLFLGVLVAILTPIMWVVFQGGMGFIIIRKPFAEPHVAHTPDSGAMTLALQPVTVADPMGGHPLRTRAYGMVPGPTIILRPGEVLSLTLRNEMGYPNPGCENQKWWANTICHINTTNLHTHGLHVSSNPPGDDIFQRVEPGETRQYVYRVPEQHMGGTHWYHPHSHHATALQAGGGAHGAIIVKDPPGALPPMFEKMPEQLVVISMVNFYKLVINEQAGAFGVMPGEEPKPGDISSFWDTDEKNKPIPLINGLFQPKMTISSGTWYRFRFLYASIEQILRIKKPKGCQFQLIAKDGIYLHEAPREIPHIILGPGNRADVAIMCICRSVLCAQKFVVRRLKLVRFSAKKNLKAQAGTNNDHTKAPQLEGPAYYPSYHGVLLHINIMPTLGRRQPDLPRFSVNRPCYLADLRNAPISEGQRHTLAFEPYSWQKMPKERLDNPAAWWAVTADGNGKQWPHYHYEQNLPPPILKFPLGYPLEIAMRGVALHPVHLHVMPYQLQNVDTGAPYYLPGDWHDVIVLPNFYNADTQTARDLITRAHPATFTGKYVLHCHHLQHEDFGMMNYIEATGQEGDIWAGAQAAEPRCYTSLNGPQRPGFIYLTR